MTDQYTFKNPVTAYEHIEPPKQHQPEPGLDAELTPKADLGENTYRGTGRLEGRKAIVTGADSGIGAATAIAFAREGADVAIAHLPEEHDDADETLAWVHRAGRAGLSLPGDIRDEQHCEQIVASTVERLGGLDILVNNAAYRFTKNLAQELGERGIRVNSVAPGPIWTPLIPATMEPDEVNEFGQQTPLGRAGQPAELAPAFVFLASQESSYITGEILGVTGGKPLG
jgi:NAD(P)-dependent dehydrogenase (short-subunit alcohol dehydrogenase family)